MRPFTYLNVAISVDGKISTVDRRLHGFGGDEDRDLMDELRSQADAVLIGGATLRDEDPLLIVRSEKRLTRRLADGQSEQPIAVIVSETLRFPPPGETSYFTVGGVRRLIFTSETSAAERGAPLERWAEIYSVREDRGGLDLGEVLCELSRLGIRRLLLEGGGKLNFALLEAGLIDEIYLTLCPIILGGDRAPTPFDGAGFSFDAFRDLTLLSVRQGEAGRLFLRYQIPPQQVPIP